LLRCHDFVVFALFLPPAAFGCMLFDFDCAALLISNVVVSDALDVWHTGSGSGSTLSASIDETNRIRAMHGLPPLASTSAAPVNVVDPAAEAAAQQALQNELETEAMRAELAERKKQRLVLSSCDGRVIHLLVRYSFAAVSRACICLCRLTKELAGPSLGEKLANTAAGSAASWVEESRKRAEERKRLEEEQVCSMLLSCDAVETTRARVFHRILSIH